MASACPRVGREGGMLNQSQVTPDIKGLQEMCDGSLLTLCPLKFLEGFLSLEVGTLGSLMSAVADQLALWPPR